MALLDLLGRRWTLRILWELRHAPLTFRALQEAAGGLSPSVLNARLKDLREAGFVEQGAEGYAPTPLGRELCKHIMPLYGFAEEWAKKVG